MPIQSAHDRAVLGAILNPLFPDVIEEQLANQSQLNSEISSLSVAEPTAEEKAIRDLEVAGVKAAEQEEYSEALDLFTNCIGKAPTRASAYNNRAQTHRLMLNVNDAVLDLNEAIKLTGGKGKVAAQAYTQRAMIHRLQGREQDAKDDFERASAEGCVFARNQLIAMNPYAAMCNKMIGQVIAQLQRGEDNSERAG